MSEIKKETTVVKKSLAAAQCIFPKKLKVSHG